MLGWFLGTLTDNVISYVIDQSGVGEKIHSQFERDPVKEAFLRSLQTTVDHFEKRHPALVVEDIFKQNVYEQTYIVFLAQFLLRDGRPDPSTLASLWADALYRDQPEKRRVSMRQLEPIAADFLEYLNRTLRTEPALRDLQNSQAFERTAENTGRTAESVETMARDIAALRQRLESDKATPGTRRDYLHWLIERNLYLDPRGTYQTQRQVQVKLEDVYVSLRARHDEILQETDRALLEKELAEVQAKRADKHIRAEEAEDLKEQILDRFRLGRETAKQRISEVLELSVAVSQHNRLVILGDPGSGKSTLLRYLALKHAQALINRQENVNAELGKASFPLLIRIADYAEYGMPQGKSLSAFLGDYCGKYECPEAGLADLLTTQLKEGNCLLLLDGLDEIVRADERLAVVRQIEAFVDHHDDVSNSFVITSRIAGYRNARLSGAFVHYTIQEMDEAQIQRFLEVWCPAVEAAQTPDISAEARAAVARGEINAIMRAVRTTPGVRRLATNPLLLRTLALIHRTGAQLPQKRIELYKLAADTLARTWRTAQGVPESALVEETYLTRLLGKLAYWIHLTKPTGIATEKEVYRELGQEWARLKGLVWDEDNPDIEQEVKKFLRQVREHTGLFVERAPRRYGFMHLTFEEYYAARYLVARSKTRAQLLRQHLHDPRWDEPILLALGFVGLDTPEDASELFETAILAQGEDAKYLKPQPGPYEALLGQDYLFALRCLGDQLPVNTKVMRKLMKRLADELLHESGSAQFSRYRQALQEKLPYLQGSTALALLLPSLFAALKDSDANVRRQAARSLGQVGQGSAEAVKGLLTLLTDGDVDVRGQAAWSLGQVGQGSAEAVQGLLALLTHRDVDVRRQAAWSLGQIGQGSSEVVKGLLALLTHRDANIRRQPRV